MLDPTAIGRNQRRKKMLRTGNPALNEKVFRGAQAASAGDVMTLEGTVNKTIMSVALTFAAAWWSWNNEMMSTMVIPLIIGALIMGLVLSFKKTLAPMLTPAYAVAEGCVMGVISSVAEAYYPGIVFQAVMLTLGTLFALLMAYK